MTKFETTSSNFKIDIFLKYGPKAEQQEKVNKTTNFC